ncbi:uncharacterized protein isoform X2 [Rhodnius prolixus]|uniref:uncharacterized protein isoform X2 n=1 Tax=Rhodnius prolixus TaxID=13249 RepID=UPI003D18E1BB
MNESHSSEDISKDSGSCKAADSNGLSEIVSSKTSNSLLGLKLLRNKSVTNPVISPSDIAKEFLERVEKKRPHCPDGVDVCLAMTSPSQLRLPKLDPPASYPKLPKLRDANKPSLDASELLSILEGGAETYYAEKPKPKTRSRGPRDLKIDPELEKSLALKQLMEFSSKRGRPKKEAEKNNNISNSRAKPKKKEVKRGANRELHNLLQDEGAINMLYSVEKGETETKDRLLSSKRRKKKVLLKKAQEVQEALLGATSNTGVTLRHRTAERRKPSVESVDSEHSGREFTFTSPAEASKIIRRHSSSSSYSSRGSSPQRTTIDFEKSPGTNNSDNVSSSGPNSKKEDGKSSIKMSERAEKLIEMKCKEFNLQPEHSTIIKQLIQDKKNGLKERLQVEFKNKFKAAISAKPLVSPRKESKSKSVTAGSSSKKHKEATTKPIWKCVAEDWDTMDESDQEGKSHSLDGNGTHNSAGLAVREKLNPKNVVEKSVISVSKPLDSLERRYKELTVEKMDSVIYFNIAPTTTNLPQSLNAKVLTELSLALDHAEQSADVRAIVFTCLGDVFCNGVDLPSLLADDKDKRRLLAAEMAIALKEFVCKLSMVGKPVLVGVSGQAVGLGVVLLAYCDYVLCDETSTFLTPYPKLGCLPEGAATLALPHVIGHRMAASLLLGCTRLTSGEAEQCGLVTKVIPKQDLFNTLMQIAQNMSAQSTKI